MYFGRAERVNKTYRLTSTGSTIQLHYTAPKSHSATSRGFVASYKQREFSFVNNSKAVIIWYDPFSSKWRCLYVLGVPECNFVLVANTSFQRFSSPGYIEGFSPSHRLGLSSETCDWIITTSSDKQILLKIFDINLDEKKREALYVSRLLIDFITYYHYELCNVISRFDVSSRIWEVNCIAGRSQSFSGIIYFFLFSVKCKLRN